MAGPFLFRAPEVAANQALGLVGTGGGCAIAQPEPAASRAFALEIGAWRFLPHLVREGLMRGDQASRIASRGLLSDPALFDAWSELLAAAADWGHGLREGFRALANDIVSYADDIAPDAYGRLGVLLGSLGGRVPSHQEAQASVAILEPLAVAAEDRARLAWDLGEHLGPFSDALVRFGDVFAQCARNPAVRVVLSGVSGLCLSYDDEGWACAGDMKYPDQRQYWMLEPSGDAYVLMSAADPSRVLVMDRDEALIDLTRALLPWTFACPGPKPRVEFQDKAPRDAALFQISFHPEACIQNVNYETLALDCAVERAEGRGRRRSAPIVAAPKTGGPGQRWSFEPGLRSPQDLMLYDLVAPVARLAQQVGNLKGLRQDWSAVADDLRSGVRLIVDCVDREAPLAASLHVDAALACWRRLAAEAREVSIDLANAVSQQQAR